MSTITLKDAIEQYAKLERSAEELAARCRSEIMAIDARIAEMRHPRKAERPRCGAQTRSGGLCGAPAVRGGSRCRLHGGAGFDAMEIQRIMLKNQRKEIMVYLAVCEGLAGRSARRVWGEKPA